VLGSVPPGTWATQGYARAPLLARTGGWFDHVVFAVHDRQPDRPTYTAFANALT